MGLVVVESHGVKVSMSSRILEAIFKICFGIVYIFSDLASIGHKKTIPSLLVQDAKPKKPVHCIFTVSVEFLFHFSPN